MNAIEPIRTEVEAIRVSKTSIKEWHLFGPIDQALKTSIQTTAVRAYSLSVEMYETPCT
jgi:hypothetical protein